MKRTTLDRTRIVSGIIALVTLTCIASYEFAPVRSHIPVGGLGYRPPSESPDDLPAGGTSQDTSTLETLQERLNRHIHDSVLITTTIPVCMFVVSLLTFIVTTIIAIRKDRREQYLFELERSKSN